MINAGIRVVYRLYLFCVQIGPLWLLILAAFGSSLGLLLRRRVGRGLVSQRRALCQWMLWFYLAFILIQTVFSRRVLFGADAPLAERIDLRLGDGLTPLVPGEADVLIIAGMGGALMQRILREGEAAARAAVRLILSPQSELEQFRRFLRDENYFIERERLVEEDGKY